MLALATLLPLTGCATAPPPVVVKTIDFKTELRRSGEWIVVAPYGRVWHPRTALVGADFVPYLTGGGWKHGPTGWTFQSKWDWGKYVFHYGRWFVADDLGWLWWPDQDWAPAWVAWRTSDGHVGWSPLPPQMRSPRTLPPAWVYVKMKYLSASEVETFLVSRDAMAPLHQRAQPLPPGGPDPQQVEAAGGMERNPALPEAIPAVLEAPPPDDAAEEVAEEPTPPPKKGKKKKRSKRR